MGYLSTAAQSRVCNEVAVECDGHPIECDGHPRESAIGMAGDGLSSVPGHRRHVPPLILGAERSFLPCISKI